MGVLFLLTGFLSGKGPMRDMPVGNLHQQFPVRHGTIA